MKDHRSILALSAITLCVAASADAVPTASYFDLAGFDLDLNGSASITQPIRIEPGGSFTVRLRLDTDAVPTIGFDYALSVGQPAGSGLIRLTGRANSVFSEPFTDDSILFSGANPVLSPSTVNLGGLISDIGTPLPGGTYTAADLTLFLDPSLAPGLYTISTLATLTDQQFESVTTATGSLQIRVVPEPGTALFGLACLGAVAVRRRRSKG